MTMIYSDSAIFWRMDSKTREIKTIWRIIKNVKNN